VCHNAGLPSRPKLLLGHRRRVFVRRSPGECTKTSRNSNEHGRAGTRPTAATPQRCKATSQASFLASSMPDAVLIPHESLATGRPQRRAHIKTRKAPLARGGACAATGHGDTTEVVAGGGRVTQSKATVRRTDVSADGTPQAYPARRVSDKSSRGVKSSQAWRGCWRRAER